ncbi:glycosyltransferase [bacterium]|nr:glycosyltransferase [bacterium]
MIARSFHANGPGKVILNLLRAWTPEDVRVSLVALSPEGALRDLLHSEITRLHGTVVVEPCGMFSAGRIGLSLTRRAPVAEADVLMAHLLVPDAVGRSAAKATGKPLIVVEHGIHGWSEKGRWLRPLVREWYLSSLPRRCRIVAISGKVQRDLLAEGVAHESVRLIPNGVELMDRAPEPTAGAPLVVGVVGNLICEKRPHLAVEAAAVARAAGLPVTLCFVGEGPLRISLETLAKARGVPCQFVGRVADPRPAYAGFAAQLHPSRQESFGLAPLEGLSAGLPVIAAAESGLAELLPPRPAAWLVGDDSAAAWGTALVDALSLATQPRAQRREWVGARYGLDRMAASHLALIREQLN